MNTYPITESQIAFYEENGYIQLHDVLTEKELEDARRSLEEVLQLTLTKAIDRTGRSEYDRVFLQKVNLWREHEGIRELVFNGKLAEIARTLSRSKAVRLWHDHALIKPGVDSKPTPWHQDLPYWPMQQEGALSCWLALDDVDETNGCMQFVPGTHKLGRLEPINLVNPQDIFNLSPDAAVKERVPVVMSMKAGSCTFHNGLTFHSASTNTSGRPRRAMVIIYMRDGTTFREKPHVCTDGLGFKEGDPIAGELFPVLAEARSSQT